MKKRKIFTCGIFVKPFKNIEWESAAAFIIAAILTLFLASCKTDNAGDSAASDTESSAASEITTSFDEDSRSADISEYTVIYGSKASVSVQNIAVNLKKTLEQKTGKTIKIKDDWVMPGVSPDNDGFEILIGETNRRESKNLGDTVLYNDFLISKSGSKIVIFANTDVLLGEAVSYFQLSLKKEGEALFWDGSYLQHKNYSLEGMSMLGIPVEKFSIVISDCPTAVESYAAEKLSGMIAEKSGRLPAIVKKSAAAGENHIKLSISDDMPLDDYSVSCSGGNIELAAGGPAAILALVDSFEKRLDSAKSAAIEANQLCCTGNAYDGLAKRHDGAELRVMTSNVLFTDSESFDTPYRMKCLMQTYLSYLPDIIGLQEARNTQLNALMPYLEGEYMAVPFTASDGGQVYQQILYLRDKYILVEYGFTRFRTKVIPWGVSWAVFRRISDGKLFAVTNTHNTIVANTYDPGLSNSVEGVQYRISNCKTVLETIDGIRAKHPSIPVFSTGDWNSTISAESLGPMMQSELMKDSMLTALAGADTITNSGHTIGQLPGRDGNIIDHIFVSADAVQVIYHDVIVNDTVINGSDHCPVYADAKFK